MRVGRRPKSDQRASTSSTPSYWSDHLDFHVEHLEDRLLLSADFEFRAIGGTGNNPSDLGAADTNLIRIAGFADYPGDESGAKIIESPVRENVRVISNAVVDQAGASIPNDRQLSDFVWQWGQFLDHDIDLTHVAAANGTADISVPSGDILGPNPIPFARSDYDPLTGKPGTPRDQINAVTSFIDASNVYGSDPTTATSLRTFVDGKLKTTANGQLLPVVGGQFAAGDVRANEQVGLTSMHTLFVREHNRLADLLNELDNIEDKAGDAGVTTDEYIYQVARKIVGAEMQIITYNEFLPALLGPLAPQASDVSYSSSVDPSIANEFSTAFYRFGHSMLSPNLLLVNQDHLGDELALRDAFFNPEFLGGPDLKSPVDTGNIGRILKGLAFQLAQEVDGKLVDDVRNFLFGFPGAGGLDLASLNMQRGRDHGLPDYNALRVAYDLTPKTVFLDPGDGSGLTSDPDLAAKMASVYGNDIDNVDPWIGALVEDHVPGASVGELVGAALHDQFARLRDGDHFFYLNDPDLSDEVICQVIELDDVTLSNVIKDNTEITTLQDNVFFATGVVLKDGVLRIHGTGDADHVVVAKRPHDRVVVKKVLPGGSKVFDATGIEQMEVLVFAGKDKVVIRHHLPVSVDGGAGNDKLIGGFGPDILQGALGDDVLKGRSGRDVLIGGLETDKILGGSGEDILISGTTSHDGNAEALYAILAEWNSDRDYQTRVENLGGTGSGPDFDARLNGKFFLQAGNTVFDDGASDFLVGGPGPDWFFD